MARKAYSKEFRESAVKMVLEQKRTVPEAAANLGVECNTLRYWLKTHRQRSGSSDLINSGCPPFVGKVTHRAGRK